MTSLHVILTVVHALAAGAWLGAMVYSYAVLHPRAKVFFRDPSELESFLGTISQGARWKVLSAFAIVFVSGAGLVVLQLNRLSDVRWHVMLSIKGILFIMALWVFGHASWIMWPRRIFATPEEIPAMQRRFRWVARWMILLVGASFVLGVLMHL